jgi:hypothetical protein
MKSKTQRHTVEMRLTLAQVAATVFILVMPLAGVASETERSPVTSSGAMDALIKMTGGLDDLQKVAPVVAQSYVARLRKEQPVLTEDVLSKVEERLTTVVRAEMSGDELKSQLRQVYARHFNQAEAKEIVRFLNSPVGMKFRSSLRNVLDESADLGRRWMRELEPRLRLEVDATLRSDRR